MQAVRRRQAHAKPRGGTIISKHKVKLANQKPDPFFLNVVGE